MGHKDTDSEHAETNRRINALRQETAARLQSADGKRELIVAAIRYFLSAGMEIVYSPSALWDYFAISHPDLPTLAGYNEAGRDRIVRIYGTVSREMFGNGRPVPDGYPHDDAEPTD